MGFIDALALASRGVDAVQQGKEKRRQFQDALAAKDAAAAVDADYKRAQTGEADARAYALRNPQSKLGTQSKDERLFARIRELGTDPEMVTQYPEPSKRLAAANARARMEFGEAPPSEPQGGSSFVFPTGTDEGGNPVVLRGNTRTGALERTPIGRPQSGGSAIGSQAPVGDMEARYAEIEQHAKDLAAGKWHPTRAMQAREGMEYGIANQSAGGHGVPLTQAGAIAGMDMLGVADGADYQRFQSLMNSTRSFGDDAAKVFKGRQNEDAVKREIALSQITPDDYNNPQQITQKLQRMREVIDLAKQTMPHAGSPSVPGGASRGGRTVTVNGKTFRLPE